ncbi:Transcriptional regulator, LysR family [Candidatus Rhodobacter oscarellae]|uniref:Transcriptional regulator, LysR family n=1 Tax=Candidatus Rhodobacter oscarellae TaxID=1675527 RepID=A0A0J9E4D7_9RHOB|nr:LysR family transcriptional regulator [Candidatus Rhodobacter lobularis]KMW57625.1 Transcriptional regulator, LysR family [Candidatus Rhodobacter lobularis]
MQINALETLVVVRREASFSRAAQVRNMTLSAVSMQMKALEEALGVPLFDRGFRPPKLTPLGQQVAKDAVAVVEAHAVLRARCAPSDVLRGLLRIGFVPSIAARVLPEFLRIAARKAPAAQFELTTGLSETLSDGVRQGRLDAAVVTEIAEAGAGLQSDRLVQEEMVVIAPQRAVAQTLVDLSRALPFLHFIPSSGIGKLIARYGREMGLSPSQVINLDSIEAIVRCVQNGLGYSLLPKPDALRYGDDGVQVFPCAPERLYRDVALVSRADQITATWQPRLLALLGESM